MKKHISIAAVIAFTFAVMFFAMYSVGDSNADTRSNATVGHFGSAAGSFFPVRPLEPYW